MAFAVLTSTQKDAGISPITTTGIDTTGATLILIQVGLGQAPFSLTDSPGNRYFQCYPVFQANSQFGALLACFNPVTNASHTFTLSSGNFPSIAVTCFSGIPGGLVNNTAATASTSTTLAMPTLTPPNNNALVVTGICSSNNDTASIDGGFTISVQGGGVSGQKVALAYLIQTSAAAAAPTWTLTAARIWGGQMFAIGLGSGGGGGSAGGSYGFA